MSFIVPVLIAAGTGVGVYQALQQGQVAEQNATFNALAVQQQAMHQQSIFEFQAEIANRNAEIALRNAAAATQDASVLREQAGFNADRLREKARRIRGTQEAAVAASGIQIEGSPTDVIYDTALQAELEVLLAVYSGEIEAGRALQTAGNYEAQATNSRIQAGLLRMQGNFAVSEAAFSSGLIIQDGRNARRASRLQAAGLLLQGGAQAAGSFNFNSNNGIVIGD